MMVIALLCCFIIYCCVSLGAEVTILNNKELRRVPPDSGNAPSPPPKPALDENCGDDLRQYCPTDVNIWRLYCLYNHKDNLSDKCSNFIGVNAIGGCNVEAQILCSKFTTVEDITKCLLEHKDQLGEMCAFNLDRKDDKHNEAKEEQRQSERNTKAVTVLSAFYLLIPIFLGVWAWRMSSALHKDESELLTRHTDGSGQPRHQDTWTQFDGQRATSSDVIHSQDKVGWRISYHELSYWAGSSSSLRTATRSWWSLESNTTSVSRRKQILHEVRKE